MARFTIGTAQSRVILLEKWFTVKDMRHYNYDSANTCCLIFDVYVFYWLNLKYCKAIANLLHVIHFRREYPSSAFYWTSTKNLCILSSCSSSVVYNLTKPLPLWILDPSKTFSLTLLFLRTFLFWNGINQLRLSGKFFIYKHIEFTSTTIIFPSQINTRYILYQILTVLKMKSRIQVDPMNPCSHVQLLYLFVIAQPFIYLINEK